MSKRATDFAAEWVQENINADAYDPPQSYIDSVAAQLRSDANAEGITDEELEEGLGDLPDYVSQAMEEATDNEVDRLASRND